MVHKPKHRVHSFRGLLLSGGQDEINLERQNVNLAYRIVKLDIMVMEPGEQSSEHTVQIWKEQQTSVTNTVDFRNPDLLGMSWLGFGSSTGPTNFLVSIFDNMLFSRNIYVAGIDTGGTTTSINYYLEIEEVPVSSSTLMQLKLGVARKLNLQQD